MRWNAQKVIDGIVKTSIVMRWYVQDELNQEESEQDEVDEMKEVAVGWLEIGSTSKMMHIEKSSWWFVLYM